MSILFALAAAVGFGSSDFAAGHASRRSSAVSVVILTHFASFIALLAVSLFPGQGGSPTVADIGWGLAAGLGGGFGAMFLFRGLGKGSMAVVAPITAAGAATIPVVAGLLQGEAISIFGVFGVSLALVAIVMISLCADEADEASNDAPTGDEEAPLLEAIASVAAVSSWTAPVGPPVAVAAPTPLSTPTPVPVVEIAVARVAHEQRFAPVFAPPITGPASLLAASTPLAAPMSVARTLPAPLPSAQPLHAPTPAATPVPLPAPLLAAPIGVRLAMAPPVLAAPGPAVLVAPAPTLATPPSFMPPPLMHHSIVEPAPTAGVALLDRPSVPDDVSSLLPQLAGLSTLPAPSGQLATALALPPPPAPLMNPPACPAVAPVPPAEPKPFAAPAPAPAPVDLVPSPVVVTPPVPVSTLQESSPGVLATVRSILRRPGIVDALLSGVGFGLFFVFIARTAETAGQWPLVSARGISAAMFFVGALVARGAVLPEKGSRRAVVLAGVLDAIAAVFFVLSTRAGLLSVGAVLASLYPAATIVLARFISHERISRRQLFGLMLAGLAVSLLAI